ncbi:helix-turn-helix domain-containing protein [Flavobacterium caseinilyticum]|uniref:DNA-binding protein n=1 Tax=Flavobacterium caseinilyticum TaxID=2541732 RepID=A0A4R5AX68_9FLAO|nr:helix-turn-helix domain-containing protein [Flavobacterium caseinilyticum]TDD75262.1 DNA-binding protein [Flavobacterium caseinilyticum]
MNTQIFLNGITLEQLAEAVFKLQQQPVELPQPENEFITRDEVCKLLNFNKTSLWKHTKSGKLKSYGIGNRVLYKKCEVLEAVKPINH